VEIPPKERDGGLGGKLRREGPQILRWLVDGWADYRDRGGLAPPKAVEDRTAKYRRNNDIVGQFISECCVEGGGFVAPAGDLYRAYRDWAERNGHKTMASNKFGPIVEDKGFEKERKAAGVRYCGLRIEASVYPPPEEPPDELL
jgi:putative DNA primase/helicase